MKKILAILCPAHPSFYPHIARHAEALRPLFSGVEVYCIFRQGDELPKLEGVDFFSVMPELPSGPSGFWKLMRANGELLKKRRPHVVEAIDPPSLIPASAWCKRSGSPLVYFSMELFVELPSLRRKPLRRLVWKTLESRSIGRNMPVLTVSRGVADILEKKFGKEVTVVRSMPPRYGNPPKEKSIKLRSMCSGIAETSTLLVYQGTLEAGRGLGLLLKILEKCGDIHLAVFGYGPLEKKIVREALRLENLHFFGRRSGDELRELTSGADIGLLLIEALSESYRLALPGKTFEFLHAGLPVLASDLPELRRLFNEHPFGEISFSLEENRILQTLDRLKKGISTGRYAHEIEKCRAVLCWEEEQKKLVEVFRPFSGN